MSAFGQSSGEPAKEDRRGRPRPIRPAAPFNRDPREVAASAFDRDTGEPLSPNRLKSVKQAIAQYHVHPEVKFRNGDHINIGMTERRHVSAICTQLIGKEANKWEVQLFIGIDEEASAVYGAAPEDVEPLICKLRELIDAHGQKAVAKRVGVSDRHLRRILDGSQSISSTALRRWLS